MRCRVCNHEYDEKLSSCPNCGFLTLRITDYPETQDFGASMVRQYRQIFLDAFSLRIRLYGYDKNLTLKEEKEIDITRFPEIEPEKNYWIEDPVCHKDKTDGLIRLPVVITRNQETMETSLAADISKLGESFHLGLRVSGEMQACILFGDEELYVQSEPVDIM